MDELQQDYPWTKAPVISCAPMRLITTAPLAVAVSRAGGLGFIGAGSDVSTFQSHLDEARRLLPKDPSSLPTKQETLPLGAGFLIWGAPLQEVISVISRPEYRLAAIWLFAPRRPEDLATWTKEIRAATNGATKVWIQVGTVAEATAVVESAEPDVLVVQGQDAGGHGLTKGAGLIPLLPETIEAVTSLARQAGKKAPQFVATGAIMTGSCLAAALAMGAQGATLGTRYLASPEANLAKGYQQAVLRAKDGGISTVRSHVYDTLRGTTDWPPQYGGRGVVNASFEDYEKGVNMEENKKLYDAAMKKGDEGWDDKHGRLCTYAGTGVGLIKEIKSAEEITKEVREEGVSCLKRVADMLNRL